MKMLNGIEMGSCPLLTESFVTVFAKRTGKENKAATRAGSTRK